MFSQGSTWQICRTTVRPPTPESKMPMGNSAAELSDEGGAGRVDIEYGAFTLAFDQLFVSDQGVDNRLRRLLAVDWILNPSQLLRLRHKPAFNQRRGHLSFFEHDKPGPANPAIGQPGLIDE